MQRNELLSDRQRFLRKKFGRFVFTNFLINFFQKKNIENIAEELFQNEIEIIKNFLPYKAENIMDVGCGLGIINIFLNQIYENKVNFYLLDKNQINKKIKYGYSYNYESYNKLDETKKLLLNNGLDNKSINIYDVDKEFFINKKIDLVISLKSMCYHYPIDIYLKLFSSCCDNDTTFIFDVTEGLFSENLFKNYFEEVNIIYEEKSIHSLIRLCCKKFKLINDNIG